VRAPVFRDLADYRDRLTDETYWRPCVTAVLARHGLELDVEPSAGAGSTYPTLLVGDVVVKLFGGWGDWRRAAEAERAALATVAGAPDLRVPRVLATGALFPDAPEPWPYVVMTRVPGVPWEAAALSRTGRHRVSEDLGRQIGRLHGLQAPQAARVGDLGAVHVTDACARSSLPRHLLPGIERFLAVFDPADPVFVHGDLMVRHVFVENGGLVGIIDWGDAMMADRHYELAKLHLDLFDGDKAMLATFLQASGWPMTPSFARDALAQSLLRQAHGLVQHHSMDVFHRLPHILAGRRIGSLDALAEALFAF